MPSVVSRGPGSRSIDPMDKRTVLAFFLIALILLLMRPYYRMVGLAEPEPEPSTSPDTTVALSASKRQQAPTSELLPPPETPRKGELFHVKNDLFTATVSSQGGGTLASYALNDYRTHDGQPVDLIRSDFPANNLLMRFDDVTGRTVSLSHPFSLVEYYVPGDTLTVGPNGLTLTFQSHVSGGTVSKSLSFQQHDYLVLVSMDLSAISNQAVSQEKFTLNWDHGLPITEQDASASAREFAGHLYQGKTHDKVSHNKPKKSPVAGPGETAWTALRSKYFIAAFIPVTDSNSGRIATHPYNPSKYATASAPQYAMNVGFRSDAPAQCLLYLGPLKYAQIKSLGVELEKSMSLGLPVIRPISRGVLLLLTAMHKVVPNYGVLLIVFSVLVKIVVYPLTKKSYQSTKEMQAVQPLIAEMREKYKGDPQRLNKATMRLYKEHGVNPLGGCLPMLLQMPLLFALFVVFRSTIELRQAPFLWWIDDLSSPDALIPLPFTLPLYGDQISVLPVLMGVSMFIQQRMMGTQTSGQQKFMSYFMTGFFLLIFNQFPSGLNLYYTLFNVLTILQQKYFVTPSPAPVPKKAKR
ncbi:MAG: membrane protein insertase YidC [Candidatus Neomarinimicrobiota bacterium]